jgi:hypothetical protein
MIFIACRPCHPLAALVPKALHTSLLWNHRKFWTGETIEDRDSSRPQQRAHLLDRHAVPTVIAQEQIDRCRVRRFIPPGRFLKIEAHRFRLPSVRHRERSSSRR